MEKEFLKKCIDNNMSISQIGKKICKSPTSVRYWLNKFELKTNNKSFKEIGIIDYGDNKHCPKCKEKKKISEFYKRRNKEGGSVYCKECTSIQALERQRHLKQQCVDYKGGKCECCNYNKCNSALEFHHINPEKKDFNINSSKSCSFNDKIKKELDKCIMVCANCHREIHSGVIVL